MGLLSWLLGKPKVVFDQTEKPGDWDLSENGNPVLVIASSRITVFQQDRGWKYCIADINDQQTPHFSDPYDSQKTAMDEALAHIRGETPRHASITANHTEARKEKWESLIQERERLVQDLDVLISTMSTMNRLGNGRITLATKTGRSWWNSHIEMTRSIWLETL